MDQEKIDRGHTLLREGVDWTLLERMARLHGLMPLLYKNIDAYFSKEVPPLILNQLQAWYVANARRNLLLVGQLLMLLHLFKDNDIPVIPYKGPVLAASAFPAIFTEVSARKIGGIVGDTPGLSALMTNT